MNASRWPLLVAFFTLSVLFLPNVAARYEAYEATVASTRAALLRGDVTCKEVLEAFLRRIQAYDDEGGLNSIITLDKELQAAADTLDALSPEAKRSRRLFCIPLMVKDNYNVEFMPTTGGVKALATSVPPYNASIVQRLVDAGALVLGKTNMPDFALNGMNTISSILGQTYNPYNRNITPYGSSGGTAVAMAASFGVIGLGSDTDGSIQNPSSALSVVGLRPTQGLTPARGVIPLNPFQDSMGPICRTVEDVAATLELIVNRIPYGPQNYTAHLDRNGLEASRLGYSHVVLEPYHNGSFNLVPDPEVVALFNQTLYKLQAAGATIVPNNRFILTAVLEAAMATVKAATQCGLLAFKESFSAYLRSLGPKVPIKTLEQLIASGEYIAKAKGFLLATQRAVGNTTTDRNCTEYLRTKTALNAKLANFMDKHFLDAIIMPEANQPPPNLSYLKAHGGAPPPGFFSTQLVSALSGMPAISFPVGYTHVKQGTSSPIGMIMIARNYQEATLIKLAYSWQDKFRTRHPPKSTPPLTSCARDGNRPVYSSQ